MWEQQKKKKVGAKDFKISELKPKFLTEVEIIL